MVIRNFRIIFVCACQVPRPFAHHVCFWMLQGHQTMTKPPSCHAVRLTRQSLPATCSSVNLPCCPVGFHVSRALCFKTSHFSQPRYRCRAKGCRQESAGVWKVFQRLEVLVECHHFIAASTLGLPVVEFLNRKILFSYLEASYEIITQNLHHSKISHYVV